MLLARTGYEAQFEALAPGDPELGSAALIPWDSEIFGFPVARYRPAVPAAAEGFAEALRGWSEERAIGLWMCDIAVADVFWKSALTKVGFQQVDFALRCTLANLQTAAIPESRIPLRPAAEGDRKTIEQIAGTAFQHG